MFLKRSLAALLLTVTALLLASCSDTDAAKAPAPPLVTTATPTVRDYRESHQFVGRIEAIDDIVLIPRITGTVAERHFIDGDVVAAGAPLFTLDRRELQALIRQAEADVAAARADQAIRQRLLERGRGLVGKSHISAAELDQLDAAAAQASAQLRAAEARLETASVNLSYAVITAPFRGRVSDSSVSVGELVIASQTHLATLVRADPVHVTFYLDGQARSRLLGDPDDMNDLVVTLATPSGKPHGEAGEISYIDNRIDPNSGTLKVQALITNPEFRLLPGEHAQVTVARRTAEQVLTLPAAAVVAGQQGDYVFVLADDQTVRRTPVSVRARLGTDVVIAGIPHSTQVVISGFHQLNDGVQVLARDTSHE